MALFRRRRTSFPVWALVAFLSFPIVSAIDKIGSVRDRVTFGGFRIEIVYDGEPQSCSADLAESVRLAVEMCFFQSDLTTACFFDPIYAQADTAACDGDRVAISGGVMDFTASTFDGTQDEINACIPEMLGSGACTQAIQSRVPNALRMFFVADTSDPTPSPSRTPSLSPIASPTVSPSKGPSPSPVDAPTSGPSAAPIHSPTASPVAAPVVAPTPSPMEVPTRSPIRAPTTTPHGAPSVSPTSSPVGGSGGGPGSAPTASSGGDGTDNSGSDGATGIEADRPPQTRDTPPDNLPMIIGAAVGGTVLVLLLIGLEYRRRRRNDSWKTSSQKTSSLDDNEFDGDHQKQKELGLGATDSLGNHYEAPSSEAGSSRLGRVLVSPAAVLATRSILHGYTEDGIAKTQAGSLEGDDRTLSDGTGSLVVISAPGSPAKPIESSQPEATTDATSSDAAPAGVSPMLEEHSEQSTEDIKMRIASAMSSMYGASYVSEKSDGDDVESQLLPSRTADETADFDLDPSWNPDDVSMSSSESPSDPFVPSRLFSPPDETGLLGSESNRSYSIDPLDVPPELKDRPRTPRSGTPRLFLPSPRQSMT